MLQTIDGVVCESAAVGLVAAEAASIGEPLTQEAVDELERLRRHGSLSTVAVQIVRHAYRVYGPGHEADAVIGALLGD